MAQTQRPRINTDKLDRLRAKIKPRIVKPTIEVELEDDKPKLRPMLIPKLSDEAEAMISLVPLTRSEHIPSELSRYQVTQMISIGLTHEEISGIVGIHKDTLYKYYRAELDFGKAACNTRVALRLYKTATEADGPEAVKAMMYWLNRRAGWRENTQVEMSGPNGQPIEFANVELTNEERATRVFQLMQQRGST